jgi:hypothetical protein
MLPKEKIKKIHLIVESKYMKIKARKVLLITCKLKENLQ